MTNTTTTPTSTAPSATGPDVGNIIIDPRPLFAEAVRIGRGVIAGVRADQMTAATPCDQFDVRDLTRHLVAVLGWVAVFGEGGDPFSTQDDVTGVADDEWAAAYDTAATHLAEVWADDAVLTNLLTLPWAQLPGAITLMIYTSEVTVHTWDLAVATGQHPDWDADVVRIAVAAMQQGLPSEGRMERFAEAGVVPPFQQVVPVGDDAAPIDRLVAWCGRNPAISA